MAFVGHNHLAILGDFFNQDILEEWQFSLNFGGDLKPSPASPDDNAEIESTIKTWWNDVKTLYPVSTRVYGFKWNEIGPNGNYVRPEQANSVYFDAIPGTHPSGPEFPPQLAVAVSLQTPYRGGRYRGRFYLPPPNVSLGGDLRFTGSVTFSQKAKALIESLNSIFGPAPAGPGLCIVASTKGVNTKVTQVAVGDRFDVQRRRGRSMPEFYSPPLSIT